MSEQFKWHFYSVEPFDIEHQDNLVDVSIIFLYFIFYNRMSEHFK